MTQRRASVCRAAGVGRCGVVRSRTQVLDSRTRAMGVRSLGGGTASDSAAAGAAARRPQRDDPPSSRNGGTHGRVVYLGADERHLGSVPRSSSETVARAGF